MSAAAVTVPGVNAPSPDRPQGPFTVTRDAVTLHGQADGHGPTVLLLHGLTATRRYVLHGSRAIERAGYRVVSYDARGHGESTPSPDDDYAYPTLADDALAVLDAVGAERAVLMGSSMGSATAIAVALAHPERVAALVIVTPAHRGHPAVDLTRWDRLSAGLAGGGVDGFMAAYGTPPVPERMQESIRTVLRQRIERHRYPRAVAAALHHTPRSAAFAGMQALTGLTMPTLIVASGDTLDPEHPLRVAEEYVAIIPGSRLVTEADGESPLAWRGGALSQAVLGFLSDHGITP